MSPAPSIETRQAEADDATAIAIVLADAFAQYLHLYTPEGYTATAIRPEEVVSRIEEGPVWVSISGPLRLCSESFPTELTAETQSAQEGALRISN